MWAASCRALVSVWFTALPMLLSKVSVTYTVPSVSTLPMLPFSHTTPMHLSFFLVGAEASTESYLQIDILLLKRF